MEERIAVDGMLQADRVVRVPLELDAGADVASTLSAALRLRGELLIPGATIPDLLMVCLPGGGMNRHYFDLPATQQEERTSFAAAMVDAGIAVALIDPPGTGESDVPADPYLLTPDLAAAALRSGIGALVSDLSAGTVDDRVPPLPGLRSIGVGHSYGAALTIAMQRREHIHCGLVLMGFGVAPIAGLTPPEEHALPLETIRAEAAAFTRKRFPEPYLDVPLPGGARSDVLRPASDRLLATGAYATIVPGFFAPDAAAVNVPLLLALGDRDLHGPPHETVRQYPGARDVTLLVLPETRHNHFAYPSRADLFARVLAWTDAL